MLNRYKDVNFSTLSRFSIERANVGIMWSTPDGQIIYANEKMCSIVGYNADELSSMFVGDLHPDYPDYLSQFVILKQMGGVDTIQAKYRCKDGSFVPVEICGNSVNADGLEFNCCMVSDITERKRIESELAKNYSELKLKEKRIQALTSAYIKAQEEERQLVSIELHDQVIQGLISISQLVQELEEGSNQYQQLMGKVNKAVHSAIVETRRLMKELFPSTLVRYGLVNLFQQELNELEEVKKCNCELTSNLKCKLSHETETTLYRIFHEALLNIKKHGGNIQSVKVGISVNRNKIELNISDDGVGFDINEISQDTLHGGIECMQRRAELLNGGCVICSKIGTGTTIKAWLPFVQTN